MDKSVLRCVGPQRGSTKDESVPNHEHKVVYVQSRQHGPSSTAHRIVPATRQSRVQLLAIFSKSLEIPPPPPYIVTTFEAQTIRNTTLNPEPRLMAAAVLSTSVEVEQRVQSLDDQKPKVAGSTVVRRFLYLRPTTPN